MSFAAFLHVMFPFMVFASISTVIDAASEDTSCCQCCRTATFGYHVLEQDYVPIFWVHGGGSGIQVCGAEVTSQPFISSLVLIACSEYDGG